MSEGTPPGAPDGWTTPAGWGGPSQPPPAAPAYGQPAYGQPAYGQPAYGQQAPGQAPYGSWGPRPPELKPGVVPLRPLGLGEVLDGAVEVLRRYPRPALGLAALIAVVSVLLDTLLTTTLLRPLLQLDPSAIGSGSSPAVQDALGGAVTGGSVAVVFSLLTSAVLTGALTAVVGKAVLGQPMSLAQAWSAVRPVLLRLIGLSLLTGLLVGLVVVVGSAVAVVLFLLGTAGAVLGVLVVIASVLAAGYLYVRLSLAPCVLVLEKAGTMTSLKRSAVLVKGDWWRVFGILLLVAVIGAFVAATLTLPFQLLGAGSFGGLVDPARDVTTARALVLSGIGSILTTTLVSPFTAGARALLYVDRRMRAEGLDVALAAAATART